MNVWRLNIKPASQNIDPREFCLSNNIMGVGWPIQTNSRKVEWDEYFEKAKQFYKEERKDKGWWPALNAIKNRVKFDDLCWTRDLNGIYYLGRINNKHWQYSTKSLNCQADIVNYRSCIWYKAGEVDSVPGKIVNRFIRGRALEKVTGKTIMEFSKFLFNNLSQENYYSADVIEPDFFSLIHSDDCEDIVALFLQNKGYHLIPSSCKKSTANYEYVLKHKEDGHRGVAQVKKGEVDLYLDKYEELNSKVYLFTTKGNYVGEASSNVSVLDKQEVQKFVKNNKYIMPDKVNTWIKMYDQIGKEA